MFIYTRKQRICVTYVQIYTALFAKPAAERKKETRRGLGTAHVPPTKVFWRLAVNKTILKPRLAAAAGRQYVYVGFARRKIPRSSDYTISEGSNPVPASGLSSGLELKS